MLENVRQKIGVEIVLVENVWWKTFGGKFWRKCHIFDVFVCLFASLGLDHCHHQMISFQKIYGLYGLEHHTVEMSSRREPTNQMKI